ncbi:MAG TPA: DUF6515 family protein [Chitinophagaceae bacterium]|nr:DUF6515 family protein [Chitinophagaceae bacterium]
MKTKRYLFLFLFFLPLFLLLTAEAGAQRRWRNGRAHYRPYYPPVRTFAYNRPFVSVHFGGIAYRYQYGRFYRPYGTVFRVVAPPVGIRIAVLPPGYRRFYIGADLYYYHNRTFYRPLGEREYEVIAPPAGATVSEIPGDARETIIDGKTYYEAGGTYFTEEEDENGEIRYRVAGVNGVLDTKEKKETPAAPAKPAGPQVGDRFESLPVNSKQVTINGEKLYMSPSGYYYKQVADDGEAYYEVVGN